MGKSHYGTHFSYLALAVVAYYAYDYYTWSVQIPHPPVICGYGTEFYKGDCLQRCPDTFKRSGPCNCTRLTIETNCEAYGVRQQPKDGGCPEGMELFADMCGPKCPGDMIREAPCTCTRVEKLDSCEMYGQQKGLIRHTPQCGAKEYMSDKRLCFKKYMPFGVEI